jgi:hypothetical protein
MKIEIQIDLGLSARQKRIVRAGVVASVVVAALGVGIAVAAPIDTTWVAPGQALSAAQLKANLDGLQSQISSGRFVGIINGKQYSLGATKYVGVTSAGGPSGNGTYNGAQVGGHEGAKAKCEAAFAPSAHMCVSEELARSKQAGIALSGSTAWYSTFVLQSDGAEYAAECGNWSSTGHEGPTSSPVTLSLAACTQLNPIMCCD